MVKTGDYQFMRLLKPLFKTSERLKKVHIKWNSTLIHDLNAEPNLEAAI